MKKKNKIVGKFKIKIDYSKLPNPMHLSAQQTYPAKIHKPKKGKGSFNRQKLKQIEAEED